MVIINKLKFVIRKLWTIQFLQYPIQICFLVTEKLTLYHHEKRRFKSKTGYDLNLKNPRSFNEKIVWRKIYDKNPLYPVVADKYKVREYIEDVLGKEEADNILIPLLYVTDNPNTIPFDDLPDEYIIKANHGSGTNIIVDKDKIIDRQKIINQCKEWLSTPYGFFKHEWAYQEIDRKIIIENLLRDENGDLPKDYKFHMMDGKPVFIQVDVDRHTNHKRSLFDKNWNYINTSLKFPNAGIINKPSNLNQMLQLASKLSAKFDYMRVDLYSINGSIYFGEFTCYPGSGSEQFSPLNYDLEFGNLWNLDPIYIPHN